MRRLIVAALSALLASGPALAQLEGPRPGTVETIAGPGHCEGEARRHNSSVGAIAVDRAGVLHAAVGPPEEGLVARVDPEGVTRVTRLGPMESHSSRQLAPDGSGGVLVATGSRLLHLGTGLTTLAGDVTTPPGTVSTGDGGPASAARFGTIRALATDEAGNAYLAEDVGTEAELRVRVVNRSSEAMTLYPGSTSEMVVEPGRVDTIVGVPARGPVNDAEPHVGRLSGSAPALAVNGRRLYVAASGAHGGVATVVLVNLGPDEVAAHGQRVPPGAMATVLRGNSQPGLALSIVTGLAADDEGGLYVADAAHHRVLRLDPAGELTTFAGTGQPGFNGNDRGGHVARLNRPSAVAVGPHGRVYLSDEGNELIRFVDSAGYIHAALGNGLGLTWRCVDGGEPEELRPRPQTGRPASVAVDADGSVYFALSGMNQVKRLELSGRVSSVIGQPRSSRSCSPLPACPLGYGDGGPAPAATLMLPAAIALRPDGGLYVLDPLDARVRLVNIGRRRLAAHGLVLEAGTVATVAGSGTSTKDGTGADGTAAVVVDLSTLASDVAADDQGNLFIAEGTRVRQVDRQGTISTLVTGLPPTRETSRCCGRIAGLALDPTGNLYLADEASGRVWFLNRSDGEVPRHGQTVPPGALVAVAGIGGYGVGGDGRRALDAPFRNLRGLATDASGNLYLTDAIAGRGEIVHKVDAGGALTAAVGTGAGAGFNGDGLKPARTALSDPTDVAVDRCDNLIVADRGSDRVRRVWLAGPCAAQSAEASAARRGLDRFLLALTNVFLLGLGIRWRRSRRPRAGRPNSPEDRTRGSRQHLSSASNT